LAVIINPGKGSDRQYWGTEGGRLLGPRLDYKSCGNPTSTSLCSGMRVATALQLWDKNAKRSFSIRRATGGLSVAVGIFYLYLGTDVSHDFLISKIAAWRCGPSEKGERCKFFGERGKP